STKISIGQKVNEIVRSVDEASSLPTAAPSPVPAPPPGSQDLREAACRAIERWDKYAAMDGTMGDLIRLGKAMSDLRSSLSPVPAAEDVRDKLARLMYSWEWPRSDWDALPDVQVNKQMMRNRADAILSLLVPAPSNTQERK